MQNSQMDSDFLLQVGSAIRIRCDETVGPLKGGAQIN